MDLKKSLISFLLASAALIPLGAQDGAVTEPAQEALPERSGKIEPVLPQSNPDLIFIEGEDAVSTNFNREPVLNYTCSGYRALQLNQNTPLQEGSSYNADYVFYVQEDGVYELWYGGTPPGNRDETLPSYASPFRYTLDGINISDVYREDMHVVEEYAPAYYWNYVKDIPLAAGEHRIKFEVLLRRSYDNRYFFYLDNFFLVKKSGDARLLSGTLPRVFPKDMDNRSIDSKFLSLEEYELLIRENPEDVSNYIYLSKIYSLIGDYLNALNYLKKASYLQPDEPEIMLLTAKNLIWRGSYGDGLAMYRDLLSIVSERIDLWTEAGKIAGWVGLYSDSIKFYEEGLKNSPDNLNLMANLGITYLWQGNRNGAQKQFDKVQKLAGDDLEQNRTLAEVFRINGYPDKAVPIYIAMLDMYPEALELYFDLEDTYGETGQHDRIGKIRELTAATFIETPDYNRAVSIFYESKNMRDAVLADYEEQLKNDPDNLTLRKTLAEIYFWNGYRQKAIGEYRNILTNHAYLNLLQTDNDLSGFLELMDRDYILARFLKELPAYLSAGQKKLTETLKNYNKALSTLETVKQKGDSAAVSTAELQLQELENQLAGQIYRYGSFVEKYNNVSSQFSDEKENLAGLIQDRQEEARSFEQLLKGAKWSWDRDAMMTELSAVKQDGVILGDFVLGKIAQYEGRTGDAVNNYSSMISDGAVLEGGAFSLYESLIWSGDFSRAREVYASAQNDIDEYCNYIFYITDYLDYLFPVDEEETAGYLTGSPDESVAAIFESFNAIRAGSAALNRDVNGNILSIRQVLQEKMKQGFYSLALDTYLLRNELGDYYTIEKMYDQGIDQYRQVLAIEPTNLSALFRLAQVYHLNGNREEALAIYSEIYKSDPQYNNVSSFYNDLIRDSADSFDFSAVSFTDTSSYNFRTSAAYELILNRYLSLGINYDVEYEKVDAAIVSSVISQKPGITLPVKLGPLTIVPAAGLYLVTSTDDSVLTDATELEFFPEASLDLEFAADYFTLKGGYSFDWLTDTFRPGRTGVFINKADGDISVNFVKTGIPFLKNTVITAGGEGRFYSDGNIYWNTVGQIAASPVLITEPEMRLDMALNFSYEDTTDKSPDYWSPEKDVRAGLTLGFSWAPDLNDSVSLLVKPWITTAYYGSSTNGDTKGLSLEPGIRFEYKNDDVTAFLRLVGSYNKQLDPELSGAAYWSVTVEAGLNALFPDYLKP